MNKKMTIEKLIKEYEDFMNIKLNKREENIFRYAYMVGKQGWDNKKD